MRLPKQQQKEIMAAVLVLLRPATETTERVKKVKGSSLKNFMSITVDGKGNPIIDAKDYTITDSVEVPINHSRRVRSIIELAPTMAAMTDALGVYVAKYAKSKSEVLEMIKR